MATLGREGRVVELISGSLKRDGEGERESERDDELDPRMEMMASDDRTEGGRVSEDSERGGRKLTD